jgi:diacylglycerol O-acyltransferase
MKDIPGLRQLTGVDASFLSMETSSSFTHVNALYTFDAGDRPPGYIYEAVRSLLAERLPDLELYRRRLVEVPLGLDLPYWVEDPDFDLDYHVRHHAVPAPGTPAQVAEVVSRIVGRPLDRTRPLWELYVIEGIEGGKVALLNKIHHATIDGASGAALLARLFDTDPEFRPTGDPEAFGPVAGARLPTDAELLQRTAAQYLRRPEKFVRLSVRTLREIANTTGSSGITALADLIAQPLPGPLGNELRKRLRGRGMTDRPPALPPTAAPRTPFNGTITPHRRFAYTSMRLEQAKAVKNALSAAIGEPVTLNDVVMAICSGALRRYLDAHGCLPDAPLVAMVPVSVRSSDEADAYSNRISGMLCNLATDIDDPIERLATIAASTRSAKEMQAAIPAASLMDFTQFAPPAIAARAMRMYSRTRIADRFAPPFNLIISNVPGPSTPLYCAGVRLDRFYPVSALIDGQGLNITVQSYCGSLDFGLIACRELVPDVWDITDMLHEAMGELTDAVTRVLAAGVSDVAADWPGAVPAAAPPASAPPADAPARVARTRRAPAKARTAASA